MSRSVISNTIKSREIRVFLSSTFRDMEEERNYLMAYVFPDIRSYCHRRHVAFSEIDLRWGVTEEESKAGRAVEICLEEIDRCREYPPFFIGFLGERYGWIPAPDDIQDWKDFSANSTHIEEILAAMQQGISVTELEMQYGFLKNKKAADHARVFLRSKAETMRRYEQTKIRLNADKSVSKEDFYDSADGKLDKLKYLLRQSPCLSIDGYESIIEMGEAVKIYLLEAVDRLFPEKEFSEVELKTREHYSYAQSRRHAYVPLEEDRKTVLIFLEAAIKSEPLDNAARHIAVTGVSGRGKSAFLSNIETDLLSIGWVFSHYIGADGDRTLENWLNRLLDALDQTGKLISDVPAKSSERWKALFSALQEVQVGLGRPLYLLLDAVNQCVEEESLEQLSRIKLPVNVALIITTTNKVDDRLWVSHTLAPLSAGQRKQIILDYLGCYRKGLGCNQVRNIVDSQASAEPLFLRLLLDELRFNARHDNLDGWISILLDTGDAKKLFVYVLDNMDRDYQSSSHIKLASRIVRLLAASRKGLYYNDIAKLVASEGDQLDPIDNCPRLADAVLSPLLARLEAFCLRDDGRIYIMHDALMEVALQEQKELIETREKLITYFSDGSGASIAERVHQYRVLQDANGLVGVLGCLSYSITLFEYEALLLSHALYDLGAGVEKRTKRISDILFSWGEEIERSHSLHETLDNFNNWLAGLRCYSVSGFLQEVILKWRMDNLSKNDPNVAVSLSNMSMHYEAIGDLSRAESYCRASLAKLEDILPDELYAYANCMSRLVSILVSKNNLDEAEDLFWKANKIYAESFPSEYIRRCYLYSRMANLYVKKDLFKKAEKVYLSIVESMSAGLGSEHLDVLTQIDNLAYVYKKQGRFSDAEILYEKTFEVRCKVLPEIHHDLAVSLSNLSDIYNEKGQISRSEDFLIKALSVFNVALPDGHPDTAACMIKLSAILKNKDRLCDAESMCLQAYNDLVKAYSFDHSETLRGREILANIYRAKGDFQESKKIHFDILALRKKNLPEWHHDIGKSFFNIADIFMEDGDLEMAENYFNDAVHVFQSAIMDSENVAACKIGLGRLYIKKGLFEKAEEVLMETLIFLQDISPESSLNIAYCKAFLADVLREKNRLEEAERLYDEALEVLRIELPNNGLIVVSLKGELAALYARSQRYSQSESLLKKAIEILHNFFPRRYYDLSICLSDLAILYHNQNKLKEAEAVYIDLLELLKTISPPGSIETADAIFNIAQLCAEQKNWVEAEGYYNQYLIYILTNFDYNRTAFDHAAKGIINTIFKQKRLSDAKLVGRVLFDFMASHRAGENVDKSGVLEFLSKL